MKLYDSGKNYRKIGAVIDYINTFLGVSIIIMGLLLLIDTKKYNILFPGIFFFAAFMNMLLAFKHFKMGEMMRTMTLSLAAVFLLMAAVISLMGAL